MHTIETTKQNLEEAYKVEFKDIGWFLASEELGIIFPVNPDGSLTPEGAHKLHLQQEKVQGVKKVN